MSRSYRKPYTSVLGRKNMKAWRSQENRRLRHNAKRLINTCKDYDNLILPILNDYETLWGSPRDGRNHYQEQPLINQCAFDASKFEYNRYGSRDELDETGHSKRYRCKCYTNKRSWYWKIRRK